MTDMKPRAYPGNSLKDKEAVASQDPSTKPEIVPVVTGNVIMKKKKLRKRVSEFLFGSENKNIFQYAVSEILIPAAKTAFYDMVTDTVGIRLFGEGSAGRRRYYNQPRGMSQGNGGTYISYDKYNQPQLTPYDQNKRGYQNYKLAKTNLPDIILDTKVEATGVIAQLRMIIEQYNQATVQDLFSMLNARPPAGIMAQRFGWDNLTMADAIKVPEGWLVDLPSPIALD